MESRNRCTPVSCDSQRTPSGEEAKPSTDADSAEKEADVANQHPEDNRQGFGSQPFPNGLMRGKSGQ